MFLVPIYVSNPTYYTGLGMDSIEVQRSSDAGETYRALMAASAEAATVTGTNSEYFPLEDTSFTILISGVYYTVNFTDPGGYLAADAVSDINTALSGLLTASTDSGSVVLTLDTTGYANYMTIVSGSALSPLGFTAGSSYYGKSAYIALTSDTHYFFEDTQGVSGDYYRYRFVNSSSGAYTDWTEMEAEDWWDVSQDQVCLAYAVLKDVEGSPLTDIVVGVSHSHSSDSVSISGSEAYTVGDYAETETDEEGYACLYLTRGAVVDVVLESTGVVRRITVPDSETVNLLDSSIAEDDLFEIQTFDLPSAIRRS